MTEDQKMEVLTRVMIEIFGEWPSNAIKILFFIDNRSGWLSSQEVPAGIATGCNLAEMPHETLTQEQEIKVLLAWVRDPLFTSSTMDITPELWRIVKRKMEEDV